MNPPRLVQLLGRMDCVAAYPFGELLMQRR